MTQHRGKLAAPSNEHQPDAAQPARLLDQRSRPVLDRPEDKQLRYTGDGSLVTLRQETQVPFRLRVVPWATFTSPEVAHVGLTETQGACERPNAEVDFLPLPTLIGRS